MPCSADAYCADAVSDIVGNLHLGLLLIILKSNGWTENMNEHKLELPENFHRHHCCTPLAVSLASYLLVACSMCLTGPPPLPLPPPGGGPSCAGGAAVPWCLLVACTMCLTHPPSDPPSPP